MNIKSLPEHERPKEKLLYGGAGALSTSELLALIIRTGTNDKSAVQLADEVISFSNRNIGSLARAEVSELTEIDGIGLTKACSIVASLELARRISSEVGYQSRIRLADVASAASMLMRDFQDEKREHVVSLILNSKSEVMARVTVSIGELTSAALNPREVFSPAIKRGAAAILLAHNHPSGDPSPSVQDIEATKRIDEAGALLGISLLDHIIIGKDSYFSMRAAGYISRMKQRGNDN